MEILAVDPGTKKSAFVYCGVSSGKVDYIIDADIVDNDELLGMVKTEDYSGLVIEMIQSFGMPAGSSLFETCVWIGRFDLLYHVNHKKAREPFFNDSLTCEISGLGYLCGDKIIISPISLFVKSFCKGMRNCKSLPDVIVESIEESTIIFCPLSSVRGVLGIQFN